MIETINLLLGYAVLTAFLAMSPWYVSTFIRAVVHNLNFKWTYHDGIYAALVVYLYRYGLPPIYVWS